MKKIQMFAIATVLLLTYQANAQFSLNVSLNSRPSYNNHNYHYDANVDYYYLPEIEAYFDNRDGVFIFLSSRGWIRSTNLPSHCNNYNIDNGVRVALDYHGNAPYADFHHHKKRYCQPSRSYAYYDDHDDNHHGKKKHHKNKHGKKKHYDCD
jgi:hypothetical protein